MATDSGTVDEVDLIDLESASCVPRVPVTDATPEEQEHLLDVCPPKLEQKLSLTRRSQDRDRQLDEPDSNVLVTLGHDQVVPVLKRIDVVSADTIKRVRDITKNLEPVMNCQLDQVDSPEDDASKEINDAFNFLAELDNADEQKAAYPLEPTCFVDSPRKGIDNDAFEALIKHVRVINKNRESVKKRQVDQVDSPEDDASREINDAFNFLAELDDADDQKATYPLEPICFVESTRKGIDNEAFESSPPAKETTKRPTSLNFDFDGLRAARHSLQRLRSFTCSAVGLDIEPWRRKPKNCPYRKSWSAGSSTKKSRCVGDFGVKRKRTHSERLDAVKVVRKCRGQSLSSIGPSPSPSVSSGTGTCCASSSSSSSCSEVDWSWVEEVEPDCTRQDEEEDSLRRRRLRDSPTSTGARMRSNRLAGRENDASSVAMSVAAAGKAATPVAPDAPRIVDAHLLHSADLDTARDNNQSTIADVARVNPIQINESNTGTIPWLRASMRRLRQLRMPENSSVSAPNSLPDIALIAPEILAAQTNDTTGGLLRPSSAPAPVRNASSATTTNSPRRGRRSTRTRCQPRQPAPSSPESSSTCASSTGGASSSDSSASSVQVTPQHQVNNATAASPRRLCDRQRDGERDDERGEDDDEDENPLGRWPHALSPALACLGCTLGLFNISRFAILSIQFGANFIIQFLILSLVIGIPIFTLQVCLGQRLAAGAVDMWKISPLFQGVGIALLTAQAFIGIYSIVGVSWMFVYFRDSFITKQDRYRWAEPFALYREDIRPTSSSIGPTNTNTTSYKLHETVPDYFSGAVLQRHHLNEPDPGVVTLKFQVAFNLAVVWMIVFVSLSKGLRSYGKVVYVFTLVPIFGTLVLCTKLLGLTPPGPIHQLFPATVWAEFFINGRSWVAASSEVFLTWGLLGAAAMQIAAHNKHKHLLQRDTSLVIVLTFVVLLLAAFLANTCVQILKYHGYVYTTSSFERISGYTFMRPYNQPAAPGYSSTPERFMAHASFLVGQRVTRPGSDLNYESGYQVLRLSTELVPATLAILGTEQVSPFWAVLFYFILILFGIAQQLAIWHCVITGIMAINTKMMKLWETTITFFSCACAYILGLPMATELGIYVVYYLDYTVGGAWWIMVLYLVQVGAVFAVRGRPHTGEAVVAELIPPSGSCLRYWAGPLLSFTWNVVLPITLMVLSITIFKSTGYRELYTYRRTSKDYWSVWARQLGASIQLIPILIIPVVAVIQTCRYLNSGPPDIFDRIQLLYRPSLDGDDQRNAQTQIGGGANAAGAGLPGNGMVSSTTELPFEDPPPKYTPPPSYTTATGARIAKMLRQSFRRSVRRIASALGEGGSVARQRPALQQPPPPDYAAVLVEMNQGISSRDIAIHIAEVRAADSTDSRVLRTGRPNTIDRSTCRGITTTVDHGVHRGHYTVDRTRRGQTASSNLTAAEVANLLRSSIRRGGGTRRSFQEPSTGPPPGAVSIENLVEAAAPIGRDSSMSKTSFLVPGDLNKTADDAESSVSVI